MRQPTPTEVTVHCTSTDGVDGVHTAPVLSADRLGCSCTRLRCQRPGPEPNQMMEILTGGCSRHDDEVIP